MGSIIMRHRLVDDDFERRSKQASVKALAQARLDSRFRFVLLGLGLAAATAIAVASDRIIIRPNSISISDVYKEVQQIAVVQQAIDNLYAGSSTYDGLTSEVVIRGGSLPAAYIRDGAILGELGGIIVVRGIPSGGFGIRIVGVPGWVCAQLGTISVGDIPRKISILSHAHLYEADNPPLSTKLAAAYCGNATDLTSVEWTFD